MESKEELKRRVKAYVAAHEMLERMRTRELKEMSDEEGIRQLNLLEVAGVPWRENREWSGLIEQQRIFMRARKQ